MANRRAAYVGDALNPSHNNSSHDQPLDSILASVIPVPHPGSRCMLSFGGAGGVNTPVKNSYFRSIDQEDSADDYLDEYLNQPEKKRRLSVDQIQFLEKNFAAENKLEPERKIRIAKELGLQPRQIAVWFQNRRARWKSRQLETDYEELHGSYKNLKANYDRLLGENEKLKTEVLHLKGIGVAGNDTDVVKEQSKTMVRDSLMDVISEGESKASAVVFKNEELSSGKSDGTNTEFSTNGATLEFDDSDSSQYGEDELNKELLQPGYNFPIQTEDTHCHAPASSFYYGFPIDDQAFSFWSY